MVIADLLLISSCFEMLSVPQQGLITLKWLIVNGLFLLYIGCVFILLNSAFILRYEIGRNLTKFFITHTYNNDLS